MPLPGPLWAHVLVYLRNRRDPSVREALLELRRVSRALRAAVAQSARAGCGVLAVAAEQPAWLPRFFGPRPLRLPFEAGALGAALVVRLPAGAPLGWLGRAVAAVVAAGHAVEVDLRGAGCEADGGGLLEALRRADDAGLLHWVVVDADTAQAAEGVARAELCGVDAAAVERILAVRRTGRLVLRQSSLPPRIPSGTLRFLHVHDNEHLGDLGPLAHVPWLRIEMCPRVTHVPAMFNDQLEIDCCVGLMSIAGLAHGRIRSLVLADLPLEDVSPLVAMQPPPHNVRLDRLRFLSSITMLTNIHDLDVHGCRGFDPDEAQQVLEKVVPRLNIVTRFYW